MAQTLYVKAASKRAINAALADGQRVVGTDHSVFGTGGVYALDANLPDGTVIKVFEKYACGSPYAKAYGIWRKGKVA